jgi:hypothetical protein
MPISAILKAILADGSRDEPRCAKNLLDNTGSPAGAGALFGLVFDPQLGLRFVDDASNTLDDLH